MGGPMSDYRLGKIFHREYEAEVSCYWGQDLGRERRASVSDNVSSLLARSGEAFHRARCATTRLGLSPGRCPLDTESQPSH